MRSESQQAAAAIRARVGDAPVTLGLVLGTGLAAIGEQVTSPVSIPYGELAGFPHTADENGQAEVIVGTLGTARVAILKGRALYHETRDLAAMRVPLETLKLLGAEGVLLVNFAGSTRLDVAPGTLAAVKDHINLTGQNPLLHEVSETRSTDMQGAYDGMMRQRFALAAQSVGRKAIEGIYMWFPGPSFETPAEIAAARILGADLVGMSLVPEVIIARHVGLRVLAVSMVTSYAAGVSNDAVDREDRMRIAGAMTSSLTRVLAKFFEIWVVGGPMRR
jgi:purine-nucleoside phosphorylase